MIKFKTGVSISTDYIIEFGSGFEFIKLTDEDIKTAKPIITNNKIQLNKNGIIVGYLYYDTIKKTGGDFRVGYHQLKTPNKISIIGMKKGNEIIPHENVNGYINTKIFKSVGDILPIKEFLDTLRGEGYSTFLVLLIISIILIAVSATIIGFGCVLSADPEPSTNWNSAKQM